MSEDDKTAAQRYYEGLYLLEEHKKASCILALHDAQRAVIAAAKAMRDQQPDSEKQLYAAVDALRVLEERG